MLSWLDKLFNYGLNGMERDNTLNKILKMYKYQKSLYKQASNLTKFVYF